MPKHIGVVGVSPPGAALCYQILSMEGAGIELSVHQHPWSEYLPHIAARRWDAIADLMVSSARRLAAAGADFLISPCNIVHVAFDHVAARSPLPWLHIADEVAGEAARRGYRRIALLGTRAMMEESLYPEKLAEKGIAASIPGEPDRVKIQELIFNELVKNTFTESTRNYFRGVIQKLKDDGCDAAGLCCTEIPLLLNDAQSPLPLLDSTRILSLAAIRHARASLAAAP